jgi:hypothetical protein
MDGSRKGGQGGTGRCKRWAMEEEQRQVSKIFTVKTGSTRTLNVWPFESPLTTAPFIDVTGDKLALPPRRFCPTAPDEDEPEGW